MAMTERRIDMNEKMRIAEIIKKKIEDHYKDDIAIFAYYGSQATGLATEHSDLDMFFIPKTERGKRLSYQFIIDGIGYDLFPISWERIGKIVSLDQPLAAVLTQSKVLYSASEEDSRRYQMAINAIEAQFQEGGSYHLLSKAWSYFSDSYLLLFNLEHGNQTLCDGHVIASKLLQKVILSLGYINGQYYKRGIGKSLTQVYDFDTLPEDFETTVESIMTAREYSDLVEGCKKLLLKTKTLINEEHRKYYEKESYVNLFEGYYEEIKSTFNKIIEACDKEDAHVAYFRSIDVQSEISLFMAKVEDGIWYEGTEEFVRYNTYFNETFQVDLIEHAYKRDFVKLKASVIELNDKFSSFLTGQGLEIQDFESIDAFEHAFKGRD
jgi:hypothetical protein